MTAYDFTNAIPCITNAAKINTIPPARYCSKINRARPKPNATCVMFATAIWFRQNVYVLTKNAPTSGIFLNTSSIKLAMCSMPRGRIELPTPASSVIIGLSHPPPISLMGAGRLCKIIVGTHSLVSTPSPQPVPCGARLGIGPYEMGFPRIHPVIQSTLL